MLLVILRGLAVAGGLLASLAPIALFSTVPEGGYLLMMLLPALVVAFAGRAASLLRAGSPWHWAWHWACVGVDAVAPHPSISRPCSD
jgi:hypothetical protein